MKRVIAAVCVCLLIPSVMLPGLADNRKKSVICTVFPLYDWTRQVLGDRAGEFELIWLGGTKDLHSFQPSVGDIARISTCDLFIFVGGESDGWVNDVLKEAVNPGRIALHMLAALGGEAKEEEMEAEGHAHGEEEGIGYDEHLWLSLKNAQALCPVIAGAIAMLDPDGAKEYEANLSGYIVKLAALDAEYLAAAESASVRTLLFGDRFPFRYLLDDYGIASYAAFEGCSAETEASFETIVFLAQKMDEMALRCVMVTESSDQAIARTIIGSTKGKDQRILVLDAMQSVTFEDVQGGATYLSVMESNLNALREALQ